MEWQFCVFESEWNRIPQAQIERLIDLMLHRCCALVMQEVDNPDIDFAG